MQLLVPLALCAAPVYCQEQAPAVFRFEETAPVPDKYRELTDRGKMALAEDLPAAAIRYFSELLELVPAGDVRFPNAVLLLGKACFQNGEPEKTLEILDKYRSELQNSPDTEPELRFLRSAALAKLGRWAEARDNALTLTKEGTPAKIQYDSLLLCCDCWMKLGEWQNIAAALEAYAQAHPEEAAFFQMRYRLAEAFIALNRLEDAATTLEAMEDTVPKAEMTLFSLLKLRLLSLMGNTAAAAEISSAIQLYRPDKADIHWWTALTVFAETLYKTKNYADAARAGEDALKVSEPGRHQQLRNLVLLVNAYLEIDAKDKAKNSLATIENTFRDSPEICTLTGKLAVYLQQKGDNNSAADYFGKLILYPAAAPGLRYEASINQGVCLAEVGRLDEAVKIFLRSAEFGATENEKADAWFRAAGTAVKLFNSTGGGQEQARKAISYFKTVADNFKGTRFASEARFNQARLLAEIGSHSESAAVYDMFARDFTADDRYETALLQKGINMRKAGTSDAEKADAANFLSTLGNNLKDATLRDMACLEAFSCYETAGNIDRAEAELTKVLEAEVSSPMKPQALFRRAMLRFAAGKPESAMKDAERFFQDYPENILGDEIHLMIADSYANSGDLVQAAKHYAVPVNSNRNTKVALMCLYESAAIAKARKDYSSACLFLDKLLEQLESPALENRDVPGNRANIYSRALYLKGDVLSEMGNPAEARNAYIKCRNISGNNLLGLSALGRQGEILLKKAVSSMGGLNNDAEAQKLFQEADKCFSDILKEQKPNTPLAQLAAYQLAFSLNKQKKYDEAIAIYQQIYFAYKDLQNKNSVMDNFYFTKAVYDMAEILESRGDFSSLSKARSYYSFLAETGLPTAATAAERVKAIDARLDEMSLPRR